MEGKPKSSKIHRNLQIIIINGKETLIKSLHDLDIYHLIPLTLY